MFCVPYTSRGTRDSERAPGAPTSLTDSSVEGAAAHCSAHEEVRTGWGQSVLSYFAAEARSLVPVAVLPKRAPG